MTTPTEVRAFESDGVRSIPDEVATEEPMEIRILTSGNGGLIRHSLAVTMRTPGNDIDLALGFLISENVVTRPSEIASVSPCGPETANGSNIINVRLAPETPFDPARFTRNVYTTSSCGICGKASIEMIRSFVPEPPVGDLALDREFLLRLSETVQGRQTVFEKTGGLHASALFDGHGKLEILREDVGRHNAVDKIVGALFSRGELPASNTVLWVSGRASYELVQKCLAAGIPVLAAVGAPSSLAVETAREFGMTLIGFLRDGRFNAYSGLERIPESAAGGAR